MSDFRTRKAERIARHRQCVEGWKTRRCTACNGSGVYDTSGSPPCGACGGSGKERFKPVPESTTPSKT